MNNDKPFALQEEEDGFVLLFHNPQLDGDIQQAFRVDGLSPEEKQKSLNLMNQIAGLANTAYRLGVAGGRVIALCDPNQQFVGMVQ